MLELRIQDLSKTCKNGVQALKNITLNIPVGLFDLLGPNGAGKSTLMRTIATLQEPDKGSIYLEDLDVLKQKDDVRRILGYLPQEFGVYPKVSALDMLNHLAVLKGVAKKGQRKEMIEYGFSLLKVFWTDFTLYFYLLYSADDIKPHVKLTFSGNFISGG